MTVKLYDKITPNQYAILDLPFFEGAGTVVHDLSRHHNNGTLVAAHLPTWVQLASGEWSLRFAGDEAIELADSPDWVFSVLDFSFEVWLIDLAGVLSNTVFCQGDVGAGIWVLFYVGGTIFSFSYIDTGGGLNFVVSSPAIGFTLGNWHHIVMTRQATNTWLLYCDGNAFPMTGNTGMNIPNLVFPLDLGRIPGVGAQYLRGNMSRPRLYLNHALTPAEVVSHYLAERVLYP